MISDRVVCMYKIDRCLAASYCSRHSVTFRFQVGGYFDISERGRDIVLIVGSHTNLSLGAGSALLRFNLIEAVHAATALA